MTRHIAGSGTRVGQWVNCGAKRGCRLGGSHITEREFYAAKAWLQETGNKKNAKDMTKGDVEQFKTATAGQEKKWAAKAELLARKDKGIKSADIQVFEGEENLVKIPVAGPKRASAYRPNVKPQSKPATPAEPMTMADVPEVQDYILNGNSESFRKAIKKYDLSEKQVRAGVLMRIAATREFPYTTRVTNKFTGKAYDLGDVPEFRRYILDGKDDTIDKDCEIYEITGYQKAALKNAHDLAAEDNRKAASGETPAPGETSKVERPAKTAGTTASTNRVKSPSSINRVKPPSTDRVRPVTGRVRPVAGRAGTRPSEQPVALQAEPKGAIRGSLDKLTAASKRLTNVTDDISKLTATGDSTLPPRKGLLGRLFG